MLRYKLKPSFKPGLQHLKHRDLYNPIIHIVSNRPKCNNIVVVRIENYTNPSSTAPSSTFTIEFMNGNNYEINKFMSDITIQTTTPSTISQYSISKDSDSPSQVNTVYINFTTIHSIPINGTILIIYPAQVSVESSSFYVSSNLASDSEAELDASNRRILIKGLFKATASPDGSNLELGINGVRNSEFAASTDSFILRTYTDQNLNFIIDSVETGLTLSNN